MCGELSTESLLFKFWELEIFCSLGNAFIQSVYSTPPLFTLTASHTNPSPIPGLRFLLWTESKFICLSAKSSRELAEQTWAVPVGSVVLKSNKASQV